MNTEQKKWLRLVKHKPVVFGWEVGFDLLTDLHNDWIKMFLFSKEDLTLQAHRGSYKTTCLSIAIALMIILYPNQNIIFIRKADDDVKEIIKQVANMLRHDFFRTFVRVLYGVELELITESVFEIDTNLNTGTSGASQLLGIGSKGSLTGKHADIIITDDIVNRRDRTSTADRRHTIETYQELQNIKNRGGRIINTGTPWHKDDAFKLMPNIIRFDCYSTGLMTEEDIEYLRGTMEASLFAANYELRHIASHDIMFPNPRVDDGTNTEKIYDGICHIDAAYGGGDYCAFTILKEQKDGTIYVYGEISDKHIDDMLPIYEAKRKKYRAGTLYNEKNADKGYLAKRISQPVKTYHESMNKHIKISTYLKERWKDIVFIKDTDRDYIDQIVEYSENSQHDDAPDSLASLIRQGIEKKPKVKLFKQGI